MRNKFSALFMALIIAINMLSVAAPVQGAQLSDITGTWAEKEIQYFVDQGYIAGYPDGGFLPDAPVTRAEFARIANNAFKFTTPAPIAFKDVKQGDWFYNDVCYAVAAGFISGYADGTFRPNNNITREEVASIIQRIIKANANTTYAPATFTDVPATSFYNGAIGSLTSIGVMKGITATMFGPQTAETRADTAYSLYNALFNATKDNTKIDGNVIVRQDSYGPSSSSSPEAVTNVNIKNSDSQTVVRNLNVKGNVTIEETARRVYLQNVNIEGKLIINGGTAVSLENSKAPLAEINNVREIVSLGADNQSSVNNVNVFTPCQLTDAGEAYQRQFGSVVIDEKAQDRVSITLSGRFVAVDIYPPSTSVVLSKGSIDDLYFYSTAESSTADLKSDTHVESTEIRAAKVTIKGTGTIAKAQIEAANISLSMQPKTLTGSYAPGYSNDVDVYNLNFFVQNGDGVPLSGATVTVNNLTRTTDDQGSAVFTKIPYGTYDYTVVCTGFTDSEGTVSVTSSKTEKTVKLSSNRRYTLTFTVEDTSGGYVDTAYVELKNISSMYTGSSGQAKFTDLQNGTYTFTVSKSGFNSTSDTVKIDSNNTSKTVRLVSNSSNTRSIDFYVKNNQGQNVSGAVITMGNKSGVTNANGYVRISGITYGTYTYNVNADNYTPYSKTITISSSSASAVIENVSISVSQYTSQITVMHGSDYVEGAQVVLNGTTVNTNVNGVAEFTKVPGGTYTVTVSKTGYTTKQDTIIIDGDSTSIKGKTIQLD